MTATTAVDDPQTRIGSLGETGGDPVEQEGSDLWILFVAKLVAVEWEIRHVQNGQSDDLGVSRFDESALLPRFEVRNQQ